MECITNYIIENYILNTKWNDFSDKVKERAVVCAIDLMTALIIGSKGRQHSVGLRLAKQIYNGGNVPIVGSDERLSFIGATVAMSHASNSFDIDDGFNMVRGHPGTSFVGGILAAAMEKDISYREYLTTLVIAYESTIRWALAMQHFYQFLHSTGTYGSFGTAAGVGRIFGLNKETLNNALSIADFHAPIVPVMRAVEYPSMNKDGVPFGGMVGAMSVLEAMNGYEGKTHFFEMPEYQYLLDTLGERYYIMELYFKPFTCCRWAHQPIMAAMQLMKDNNFSANDIKSVTVHTFVAATKLSKTVPYTTDEAQYNLAYPIAAAIVHGDLGYMQVREESLGDTQVLDIMKRLNFIVDPEMEKQFPAKRLAWVEMVLKDNKVLRSKVFAAPGEASDNVDYDWITQKFKRITAPLLKPQKQKEILDGMSGSFDVSIRSIVETIGKI